MLNAPKKYLNSILSKAGIKKDITLLIHHFITINKNNLHFIIDEKELEFAELLTRQCKSLNGATTFNFHSGHKVISLLHPNAVYKISALQPEPILKDSKSTVTVKTLNRYIPLSNSTITQLGTIRNRITDFQNNFQAGCQCDFFCNEKLVVIGNRNLYLTIPKDFPSCFVSENEEGNMEIEYNSPLLPKDCNSQKHKST